MYVMKRFTCHLVAREPLAPRVDRYTFELTNDTLSSVPGQFISFVLTDPQGGKCVRSYSIAGTPDVNRTLANDSVGISGSQFELVIVQIEHGKGTTVLHEAPIGTEFQTTGPSGALVLQRYGSDSPPYVFCANSTGIAPFLSMLQYLSLSQSYPPAHLYWGLRTRGDVYCAQELSTYQSQWASAGSTLRVTLCLSREPSLPSSWEYPSIQLASGRIQPSLASLGKDVYQFYLCGGKEFIADVEAVVRESFPSSKIYKERFY